MLAQFAHSKAKLRTYRWEGWGCCTCCMICLWMCSYSLLHCSMASCTASSSCFRPISFCSEIIFTLRTSVLHDTSFWTHRSNIQSYLRAKEEVERLTKAWDYWTHVPDTSFHCSSSFCSFSWAITSLQWLKALSLHTSPASLLFSAWRSSNTSFWTKQTDNRLNVTKKGLGHISRQSTEKIIFCIKN